MATKTVTLNNTSYTKLDTGAATALEVQNRSQDNVRVVYSVAQPAASEEGYFLLMQNERESRGTKANDAWAMMDQIASGKVTVGE